jgi:hypothetical protein
MYHANTLLVRSSVSDVVIPVVCKVSEISIRESD